MCVSISTWCIACSDLITPIAEHRQRLQSTSRLSFSPQHRAKSRSSALERKYVRFNILRITTGRRTISNRCAEVFGTPGGRVCAAFASVSLLLDHTSSDLRIALTSLFFQRKRKADAKVSPYPSHTRAVD